MMATVSAPQLVQVLVPLYDNGGTRFPEHLFAQLRGELTERFGGLTAYIRSPAHGLWKTDDGGVSHDDVVIVEVVVEHLDRDWWRAYRETLERRFRQEEMLVRALPITRL